MKRYTVAANTENRDIVIHEGVHEVAIEKLFDRILRDEAELTSDRVVDHMARVLSLKYSAKPWPLQTNAVKDSFRRIVRDMLAEGFKV